ncbi:hypothetical protein [Aureimonas mangrovi]|uniref:hypothetical protein n=1 Tax=Aureimonas mangrovi TaxID=2758041 RepID=UPI00163D9764|nr:hypothetical protein [Aureimonas mangrovi]
MAELKKPVVLMKLISTCALFFMSLATPGYASGVDWQNAKNVPFEVQSDIEIARNHTGSPAAAFNLVCSVKGSLHFVLLTRLPVPEEVRDIVKINRVEEASIFIGPGSDRQVKVRAEVVAKGRDRELSISDWFFGVDDPDTIVTAELTSEQIADSETWFDSSPLGRVSVVGLFETAVSMVAVTDSSSIRAMRQNCV